MWRLYARRLPPAPFRQTGATRGRSLARDPCLARWRSAPATGEGRPARGRPDPPAGPPARRACRHAGWASRSSPIAVRRRACTPPTRSRTRTTSAARPRAVTNSSGGRNVASVSVSALRVRQARGYRSTLHGFQLSGPLRRQVVRWARHRSALVPPRLTSGVRPACDAPRRDPNGRGARCRNRRAQSRAVARPSSASALRAKKSSASSAVAACCTSTGATSPRKA